MSRTVGRKAPRIRGVYTRACDYCGAMFYSNKLTKLPNGLWACIDNDAKGRTEVELDAGNARGNNFVARGRNDE